MIKEDKVYMDYAGATSLEKEVLDEMMPYLSDNYGNPSSIHTVGRKGREAIDKSRSIIASVIGCRDREIVFTSGGTESINLAIKGVAEQRGTGHVITSQVEHHAVLNACKYLEVKGFDVTYLLVDKSGKINLKDLKKNIREDTFLISIIHGNNEIGTVQPIKEIAEVAKEKNILIHTDACQSMGFFDVNVSDLGVDLLTFSGSKIYGPKGTGILYIKEGTELIPQMFGGGQEHGIRSGTENVPGVVGLGKTVELVVNNREALTNKTMVLRDKLWEGIKKLIPEAELTGHPTDRLPNHLSIIIPKLDGESLLMRLDLQNIYVSSGSACSSGSIEPSHVLEALGFDDSKRHGSLRFTLGKSNTEEDVDKVLEVLPKIVAQLREMNPN